ncbi:pre-mRNA-splicing factor rse1 [Coemansia sp. RSA 1200]|nr:pre-mRNA-splicing factor rse1 [Coemansia sp. RSA 1200]
MILYNLTLQPPTSITATIVGHFSGEKHQELVVARHQWLEVWRPNTATGKISIEHSEDMFCKIRGIAAFRLSGSSQGAKDYVVLASDSGAMTILEYEAGRRRFRPVQSHEFGRSGLRRLMAGQYVAADPSGRALMVAGVERAKLVYIVTRDADNSNSLAIASPLEASRAHTLCFALAAVDVGYENPVFAAIEGGYYGGGGRVGAKVLAYYEVDLGLNHVVRRWAADVSDSANHLIALPGGGGGADGAPSGVLVCSAGQIEFRHAGCDVCAAAIPRRALEDGGGEDEIPIIVASAVHRTKATTFVLAQSDAGDLFRIAVETDGDMAVRRVRIAYFDTLAAPAGSLAILRAGFLFAATRDGGGSHQLLQFENLGGAGDDGGSEGALRFVRHSEMASLAAVDEVDSIAPVVAAQAHDLAGEGAPQIYAAGGRGAAAALRIVRHGVEVADLAAAELPGAPTGVWTIRAGGGGGERIVVSLAAATLVLELRDDEVAEAPDAAGLACDAQTLAVCAAAGSAGVVQVTPAAVRHVLRDGRVREWRPPGAREISHAAAAAHTTVVALARSGGRAVWLELHAATGALREAATIDTGGADITCVALAAPAAGRARAAFVAAGCADCAVRVFALDSDGGARLAGVVATAAVPEAVECIASSSGGSAEASVYCGLRNGMLVRTAVDSATGEVLASRVRVVGAGAVRLAAAHVAGAPAVVAMPAEAPPWLACAARSAAGRPPRLVPLAYDALDGAAGLSPAPQLPDGALAAVSGATLRVVAAARPEAAVNVAAIPLAATPRALALHPESRHFAVVETERSAAAGGAWVSRVRVVNPLDGATADTVALPPGEAAVSLALVRFASDAGRRLFLAVGCARAMTLRPRACAAACVRLFRWRADAARLELEHETAVADVPLALAPFAGALLVGLGRALRLYDLGARRLLQKAQALVAPTAVCQLRAHPSSSALRVFVADAQESVRLVVYSPAARAFRTVVDDSLPRYITAMHVLDDGDTVVAGDKFGNMFALRVPPAAARALDADPSAPAGGLPPPAKPGSPAPFRWEIVAHYHVGDIVTALTTAALVPGARPVILHATLLGSLGAAIPLLSRSDADALRALERSIRDRAPPVSSRDHASFRSALVPVRSAIDGDLCERFFLLDSDVRQAVADDVGRSVSDILKMLDDMRSLFAF